MFAEVISPHFNTIQQFIGLSFSGTFCPQKCRSDYSKCIWNDNFERRIFHINEQAAKWKQIAEICTLTVVLSWKHNFFSMKYPLGCRPWGSYHVLPFSRHISFLHEFILSDTPKKSHVTWVWNSFGTFIWMFFWKKMLWNNDASITTVHWFRATNDWSRYGLIPNCIESLEMWSILSNNPDAEL